MGDFSWKPARKKYGVVIYSFEVKTVQASIPLQIGETVQILEEYSATDGNALWYRGYSLSNRHKKGIFPASYIHLKQCTVDNEGELIDLRDDSTSKRKCPFESITPVEDPVIKEVTFVLREWNVAWKKLFVNHSALFEPLWKVMLELIKIRSKLMSNTLTHDKAQEMKDEMISLIDWGNGKLGMDRVPRVNGEQVDADRLSAVKLFRVHKHSMEESESKRLFQEPQGFSLGKSATIQPGISIKPRPRSDTKTSSYTHLMVNFKCFKSVTIGEETEILLSLYDASNSTFISEKFMVRYTKFGVPVDQSKFDSNLAIFTDLSETDLSKDLYLVTQICRHGRVLVDSSSKKIPTYKYRRPWGVAVLSLKDFINIKPEEELEFTLSIHRTDDSESAHSHMHEVLIKRQAQMIGRGQSNKQNMADISVGLKLLTGDLSLVKAEHPTLFRKSEIIGQIGFSDIITPGEIRNDLYITLCNGEFDRGSKKAAKNIEIKMTVFDSENKEIPVCISGWCGEPLSTHYHSVVYYHNNNPKWNEIIKLSIPIDKFMGAHVRLEFSHCSTRDKSEKKLYGFSFINVTHNNNVTQPDGTYTLCLYKCDDYHKLKDYTHLPAFQDDYNDTAMIPHLPSSIPFQRSPKEYITISTFLCSTKFAQKVELLGVLQWTSSHKNAEKCLHNLINLRGQEIIRYLEDLLDALFNMFVDQNGTRVPFAVEVFHALVHIFNLLEEDLFENFECVLEAYREGFSYPLVHRELMYCLLYKTEKAAKLEDENNKFKIEQVYKVLDDIFKFTVKSCLLYQGDWTGTLNLDNVFEGFCKILSVSEESVRESQVILLDNLHKIFPSLLQLIPKSKLTSLMIKLCNSMPKNVHQSLHEARMRMAQKNVSSELFKDPDCRRSLLQVCLSMIKKCMITKKALYVAVDTFGDILDVYAELKTKSDINEDLTEIIMAMFDITTQTLLVLDDKQKGEVGGMLTSCLMEMLRMMADRHYSELIDSYPKDRPLKDFLIRILLVFRDMIKHDAFPMDWTTMRLVSNHIILTAIQYIAQSLTNSFLTGNNFDEQLWSNYFDLAVAFVTQPCLQLEYYSEAKRDSIKDRYQDMRVLIGLQIETLWNDLGDHKKHFIPSMIGPFLEVTLIPERDLRKATLPIFFDMMLCHQQQHGNFTVVDNELIEKLDILITNNHGDYEYKELFQSILLDKVQSEPTLREDGKRFVMSVTSLLDKLLDYRQVVEGEDNEDKKMHCTFNILNFYKDNINREELYIRYINKLFQLHHDANNFVEAGLTLQLYAQLLQWNDEQLAADFGYGSEKQWERKEKLYLRVIECFDAGKAWEYGIPLCKELAKEYEKKFYYQKLSEILQREAKFFTNILNSLTHRQKPSYFRVVYYGKSFPPFIRNKAFIYRGDECMKLDAMKQNLLQEYPSATILGNKPVENSIKEGDAQYIQLCSVKPVPSPRLEFLDLDVPAEIKDFYEYNEVEIFQFDRPYHQGEKDKNNDFKTLWLERTIMRTTYKLPGILRWYEIIDTQVLHLSPISTAIDNMRTVNSELQHLVKHCKQHQSIFFKQMEMRLQGVISAAVNGGIPKYQEAFFCKEFRENHPEEIDRVSEFQDQVMQQIRLLEQGLEIHGQLATDDLQPLHKSLVDLFKKMKQEANRMGSPRDTHLLRSSVFGTPPRPATPGSTSQHSSGGSSRSSVVSTDAMYQDDENVYTDPDMNNDLRNSQASTASETALNQMPVKTTGLSSSVSSSHIDTAGRHPHALHRFTSVPDTVRSPAPNSQAPPLPRRKGSVPSVMFSHTDPAFSSRQHRKSLSAVEENSHGDQERAANREPVANDTPPLPPRVSPRPDIPPHPAVKMLSKTLHVSTGQASSTPPPIPKRLSVAPKPDFRSPTSPSSESKPSPTSPAGDSRNNSKSSLNGSKQSPTSSYTQM